jgi:hypothetical protein
VWELFQRDSINLSNSKATRITIKKIRGWNWEKKSKLRKKEGEMEEKKWLDWKKKKEKKSSFIIHINNEAP